VEGARQCDRKVWQVEIDGGYNLHCIVEAPAFDVNEDQPGIRHCEWSLQDSASEALLFPVDCVCFSDNARSLSQVH
jgi:hypothetical protein